MPAKGSAARTHQSWKLEAQPRAPQLEKPRDRKPIHALKPRDAGWPCWLGKATPTPGRMSSRRKPARATEPWKLCRASWRRERPQFWAALLFHGRCDAADPAGPARARQLHLYPRPPPLWAQAKRREQGGRTRAHGLQEISRFHVLSQRKAPGRHLFPRRTSACPWPAPMLALSCAILFHCPNGFAEPGIYLLY
jgi:hypothetical protein